MGDVIVFLTESRLISRHLPRRDRGADQAGGRCAKFSTKPEGSSATFSPAALLTICPLLQRRQTADCLKNAHELMFFSADCIPGSTTKLLVW
jgi:hypothetical protein